MGGSYHILEMGDHYHSYIIDSEKIELPKANNFPCERFYDVLKHKTYATSVTGNIGQCLAIIFANTFLQANSGDIVILDVRKPFKKRKTPDFLMRLNNISDTFSVLLNQIQPNQLPIWWPVECKSRSEIKKNSKEPQESALLQLISYWRTIVERYPQNVGYGITTTFVYKSEKNLIINLILLKDRERLIQRLYSLNNLSSKDRSQYFKSYGKMYNFLELGETLHDI